MRMARLCICNLWSPLQSSENQSSSCACCKLLSFAETHPLANRQQCALEGIGAGKQNRFQGEVLQKSWQDLPMVTVVFFSPILSHVVGGTFNWCVAVLNFGGSFSQSAWLPQYQLYRSFSVLFQSSSVGCLKLGSAHASQSSCTSTGFCSTSLGLCSTFTA